VEAGLGDWPALVLFLLVFSFLYTVLPLAFWGQTPGMAWAGLVARARGYESLTFSQTGRRWLGGLLTAALLGLPALLAAGGGRSMADRLSDSDTYAA
ncbi:MAG TPA: RDD family protein, partial [Thermoanaerobaculia bacterium]|nr:RDD family protein [Thermoanaerobaculia bacterium]